MSHWSFLDHCTHYLTRPRFGDSKHPTLWPSEAAATIINDYDEEENVGKCKRAIFFRYMQANYEFYPKYSFYKLLYEQIKQKTIKPDKYTRWLWIQGDLYEEYLIQLSKESGVFISGQVPVYIKDYNVSGKADILVVNPETHKLSLLEAKSVYSHNATDVIGKPSERRQGKIGTPRNSHLMQIGLYHWWSASNNPRFENSRLAYGDRGSGTYAEYYIYTDKKDHKTHIYYGGISPNVSEPIRSKITIDSVLGQYKYVDQCLQTGEIPGRDYDLVYSQPKIDKLYNRGQLNKSETERYDKRKEYLEGKRKRAIQPIVKGDWQCNYCKFKDICYVSTNKKHEDYGKPREL
jgi:hypothetical protein